MLGKMPKKACHEGYSQLGRVECRVLVMCAAAMQEDAIHQREDCSMTTNHQDDE
jgi:hypothetical protein